MALDLNKKDVLLGQNVAEQVKNIDDNFTALFDNEDDLQTQINDKESKIPTKGTAFNKNYSTANPLMDGAASAGSADNIARGDHRHPTDTSRLAASPDGKNTLLDDNNKVRPLYLPDTVVGQMSYIDTFNATTGAPTTLTGYTTPTKGDYFICKVAGTKNPDGTAATDGEYEVGDWAVYNGATWDKIDNTDAVRLVNSQKGNVETYKREWTSGATYYAGDIVLANSALYLYINATPSSGHAVTETDYFKIFGKIYYGATSQTEGLMTASDKNKLDGIDVGANKTTVDTALSTTSTNPVQNKVINSALGNKVDKVDGKGLSTNDYTTAEKTKLSQIDDSLLGVTADQIGKVKDVKVNGTTVVDAVTGIASINISAITTNFVSVSSTANVWTTKTINGITYQAIRVTKTDTTLAVFNSNNQEIVVQNVFDDTYMYICVGTAKIDCTLRKLSGNAVGGSATVYRHIIQMYNPDDGAEPLTVFVNIISKRSAPITSAADIKAVLGNTFTYPCTWYNENTFQGTKMGFYMTETVLHSMNETTTYSWTSLSMIDTVQEV